MLPSLPSLATDLFSSALAPFGRFLAGRADRKPLPVKDSVLRQLCIADDELPKGLARLKHNLLLSPSHSPSQESNFCANSDFSVRARGGSPRDCHCPAPVYDEERFWGCVQDTIEQSSSLPDPIQTFKSLDYLDQIALACLAAGFHDCRAPDCLYYRGILENIVPVCRSWPGLRNWALCITSCSLRILRDMSVVVLYNAGDLDLSRRLRSQGVGDELSKNGLKHNWCEMREDLLARFRLYLNSCILLTYSGEAFDIGGTVLEADNLSGTDDSGLSGLIGRPWLPEDGNYRTLPRVRRPGIYTQTFDPSQEGTRAASPSVDVAEVFHLVAWFRSISKQDFGELANSPFWYHHNFLPVAGNAIEEASRKIEVLGFCQKRVWEVVRYSSDGDMDLVPLMRALEQLPQLSHNDHKSCTPAFCEDASKNYTSVTQLHKCLDPDNCVTTTSEMFDQRLLVTALNGNTSTTAWKLDGMSLVAQGESYLAVSHVWSDGTGAGAWKAGQVNKCLWDFFVGLAGDLGCDGVWWDTVCIPQDKAARSIALNNMHLNYTAATYTVVHDLYLAGIEWKYDGSPCIALVLSPWFTRGWTALELLLSKRVLVLFRDGPDGDGYTLKDLDYEVLAQHRFLQSHAHWIATESVKRLRDTNILKETSSLLSVLRSRYTSWSRDQSIIAGFMCGLTNHVTLPEQEITKEILVKLRHVDPMFLLHGLPTMSQPQWSWCPPRLLDIPTASCAFSPFHVGVSGDGILDAFCEILCISKINVDKGTIQALSTDMYVRSYVQRALQKPEGCVILKFSMFDSQGLLVKLKIQEESFRRAPTLMTDPSGTPLFCKYIGGVSITPSEIRKYRKPAWTRVNIGYRPGMFDVGVVDWDHELFSDCQITH